MAQFQLPSHFTTKQIIIVGLGFAMLAGIYYVIEYGSQTASRPPTVELTVWGPFREEGEIFKKIADYYKGIRPNVTVIYKQVPDTDYYGYILNAIAEGRGPDLIYLDNRSLEFFGSKLESLRPDRKYSLPAEPIAFNVGDFRTTFPTVAEQDFTRGTNIYAMPLYIDTLALIYNKNSLDQASLAEAPRTWTDVQKYVPYLTTENDKGQLVKAAVALGGTEDNIRNGVDVLHLIQMQSGVPMTAPGWKNAVFTRTEDGKGGLAPFNFYLSFANSAADNYSWNSEQPPAMDSIASGRVAMLFGYYSDFMELKQKNPFAPLGVALMPQLEGAEGSHAFNFAKYWGIGVLRSAKAANKGWAWEFLTKTLADAGISSDYAMLMNHPPATRKGIAKLLREPDLGIFAKQALTARSWQQPDPERVKDIFNTVIDDTLRGKITSADALMRAEAQVSALMRPTEEL